MKTTLGETFVAHWYDLKLMAMAYDAGRAAAIAAVKHKLNWSEHNSCVNWIKNTLPKNNDRRQIMVCYSDGVESVIQKMVYGVNARFPAPLDKTIVCYDGSTPCVLNDDYALSIKGKAL